MTNILKKPEVLAPGGSIEAVYAAMNAGCDAVYMGGKRFGARAFANNPETDDLLKLMDDIHLRGKKIYLTVNTVLTQKEFIPLYDYVKEVYENGVDAVIVQDMGVMKFIHENFPDLQIHASTQMSVLKADAVNLMRKYGVTRVVPARELTLDEIKMLNDGTDAEIEVFVHGALCCSMSGQCLMSSLIGGRSGNRGACAQPCRKEYTYNGGKMEYYLSLKDLCALPYIPELVESGVDSFKIEGRMKKPEYVALTSHIYRKYTDIYFEKGHAVYKNEVIKSKEFEKDYTALLDVYNRGGFTAGYLVDKKVSEDIFVKERANHAGVKVGVMKGKKTIAIEREVYQHDVLEVRDKNGCAVHEHTLKDAMQSGVVSINPGYNLSKIESEFEVYRVRNNSLIDDINKRFKSEQGYTTVDGRFYAKKGKNIALEVFCGDNVARIEGSICEKASKCSATPADVISKVKVSGDSCFVWNELEICMDEDVFLSAKELKNLRRDALEKLRTEIVGKFRRKTECKKYVATTKYTSEGTEFIAECRNNEQLRILADNSCISVIYYHAEDMTKEMLEEFEVLTEKADKKIYIVLPRVTRYGVLEDFFDRIDWEKVRGNTESVKGYVLTSAEQLAVIDKHAKGAELRTADNMYVRNAYAYDFFMENGVTHVSSSVEMNEFEYDTFEGKNADVLIYGKIPVMIMLNHHGANGQLKDSYGNSYEIIYHDKTGYTEILNFKPVDKIKEFYERDNLSARLKFTTESPAQIKKILSRLKRR